MNETIDSDTMKELLFSLAWYDASCYHSNKVKEILSSKFPNADFTNDLEEFIKCKTMPPGKGNPR